MIHKDDYDAMERMFRGSEIPEDLLNEYELQRRMASSYGHVGALGMNLVIPMMRALGYGKVVEVTAENVDWRRHIGEEVIAQYGDQQAPGKLVGLGVNGRLALNLTGYGEVELPRYCVRLAPTQELVVDTGAWAKVKRGSKVVVQTADGPEDAKFVKVTPDGVTVKLGNEELVFPHNSVELAV